MIFDFPKLRYIDVVEERTETEAGVLLYERNRTIVTQSPWLRIIWTATQKRLMIGRWMIDIQRYEPSYEEAIRDAEDD
jgi:hypothetical protein